MALALATYYRRCRIGKVECISDGGDGDERDWGELRELREIRDFRE
jgi:hypothetical protein